MVFSDLIETWLPVMQGLAEYTLSLVPADAARQPGEVAVQVGINDDTGRVDPNGLFARDLEIVLHGKLCVGGMINLQEDESYRSESKIARELGRGNAVARGIF